MIGNEQIIALLFLCSLVVTYFALGNSLTESQNTKRFHETGELRMPRWIVVLFFVFDAFCRRSSPQPARRAILADGDVRTVRTVRTVRHKCLVSDEK